MTVDSTRCQARPLSMLSFRTRSTPRSRSGDGKALRLSHPLQRPLDQPGAVAIRGRICDPTESDLFNTIPDLLDSLASSLSLLSSLSVAETEPPVGLA